MTTAVGSRSAPVVTRTTGSVYLDAPRPSRYRTLPRKRAHGTRTVAATLLGIIGLAALSATALLVGARAQLAEPDPVSDAIAGALDQPAARQELELEIADAIETALIGEDLSASVAAFGVDVRAEAELVATAILDDPAFRSALDDLVTEVHHRVLVEPSPTDLDLGPLTTAALAVIEAESPVLAEIVPPGTTLATIEGESVPDLTEDRELLERAMPLAVLLTLALPLAAAVHPRRHRVMAWTGRWLLGAGLAAAVLAVALPYVGGRLTGWSTVEVAIRTSSLRLLAPAGIAGIVGMGLVSVAAVAKNRERRRVTDEGTAAALGVDEPQPLTVAERPEPDLARRGLVDAGQRLTNI